MYHFTEKYINPFTDYGFKKLFGEEPNKDLLLDFLNELLKDEQGKIKSISYIKNEQLGDTALDRKVIFDLYCESERGEKFIVELQKAKQNYFKDRTVFYSTFPIRDQAKRGEWDYKLEPIYAIAILDFVFDEDKDKPEKYRYDVKLTDTETCKVFYDKLTFVYLEMPKFSKTVEQLTTRFDKWLYLLRNLTQIQEIPEVLREQIFTKAFEVAEIAKFNPEQVRSYEKSLKYYRDLQNTMDTARGEGIELGIDIGKQQGRVEGRVEGRAEGREEAMTEVAMSMVTAGMADAQILAMTGLTSEQLAQIKEAL
ncbi:MAG: Rpn family recombination-promoting nuclease/putative transposase [Spirulina sp. SIO3F2]|nr:Rpn family recombination-promoting nuclease/putative transposase [Spirulina sp. SIO3F2]